MLLRTVSLLPLLAALLVAVSTPAPRLARANDADLLDITSRVVYDIQPGAGPIAVSWDITIVNNDPATQPGGGGTAQAYESFAFPVLRGASNLSAQSADGVALDVSATEVVQGAVMPLRVVAHRPVFFGETYQLSIEYQIPETRQPSLLLTPAYAFVPVVASGDQATVEVQTPSGDPWEVTIDPGECAQSGASFSCSGSDSAYVAALVEVIRPDAIASTSLEVHLRDRVVPVTVTYFLGEEAFAQHLSDLAREGLPVIEDIFGFTYPGPADVRIAERGKQLILGYEGLAQCDTAAGFCDIAISPIADDFTVLHELSHLFTTIYDKRWLQEGFADLVAAETSRRLPEGLVTGAPFERPQPDVELQLDDWGNVQSVLGAAPEVLELENAGYYRAQRFVALLEFDLGLETLRRANQAIAQSGKPADSRRFMDVLEEVSGRNNDGLFKEWVFPDSVDTILAERREARDRFTNALARAQEEGLVDGFPLEIESAIAEWRFDDALARLAEAEAGLDHYDELKAELEDLRLDVSQAGLELTGDIDEAVRAWDFARAGAIARDAREALSSYEAAVLKVAASRNAWQRFGLLGSDPDGDLEAARRAFNAGDYLKAKARADSAIDAINGASNSAVRRVLILTGVLAAFSLVILAAVLLSRMRDRDEFVERV